jgi:hypothetical protein
VLQNNTAKYRTNSKQQQQQQQQQPDVLIDMVDFQDGKLDYDKKIERLQDWNVAVFSRLLQLIVARRLSGSEPNGDEEGGIFPNDKEQTLDVMAFECFEGTVLDEVKDIIMLPKFDSSVFANPIVSNSFSLDPIVVSELHEFVSVLADMYRNNPFHNFEHASHVLMSVCKLLSRIVNPNEAAVQENAEEYQEQQQQNGKKSKRNNKKAPGEKTTAKKKLHDYTFGITSDPLTHFACTFAALTHDVDYPCVSNATLVKEKTDKAFLSTRTRASPNKIRLTSPGTCSRGPTIRICSSGAFAPTKKSSSDSANW